MHRAIDLEAALATLDESWKPLTVATLNDYDVRVVKAIGLCVERNQLRQGVEVVVIVDVSSFLQGDS